VAVAASAGDRVGEVGQRTSVAVLPFVDMSPGGDQEHWADGIAEEILHTLARIREIRVPARTSSFSFKGQNRPIGEIARELGVDHVLEGSVRTSGDRLRITAQLIDAREDRHLWSATFDPGPEDVFHVQTEIARAVAEALRVELDLPVGGAGPPSPPVGVAHELYLRGLFHWNRRSAPDLLLAVRHLEEATAIDPAYARAWAGLALVHAVIPINFVPPIPIPEARARMEEAAARALELDPTLAEVHAALGLGYHFAWRWDDAERAFLRALELNPRYSTAHQWYGEHLAKTGRPAQARASVERALELDPLSLVIRNDLGLVHLLGRDFPRARQAWEAVLGMDPTFVLPHFFLHRLDLLEGNLAEAEEWGRRWAALTGAATVEEVTLLTRAVGDPSLRPAALALLEGWESGPAPRWHDLAFYRTQLGDVEGAIRMLERGVGEGAPMMVQVGSAPWFDPLRDEAGFQALVAVVIPESTPGAS
jgi:TolB-like protein/Tfp pilus assembly protein PilF